jgi:hypothetical protein
VRPVSLSILSVSIDPHKTPARRAERAQELNRAPPEIPPTRANGLSRPNLGAEVAPFKLCKSKSKADGPMIFRPRLPERGNHLRRRTGQALHVKNGNPRDTSMGETHLVVVIPRK